MLAGLYVLDLLAKYTRTSSFAETPGTVRLTLAADVAFAVFRVTLSALNSRGAIPSIVFVEVSCSSSSLGASVKAYVEVIGYPAVKAVDY